MREYDDDNIQHYAPVLRRIIILIAVIVAVPVVLWTITAFMRTYIAQPVIPSPKPLAVTEAAPPMPVADTSANSNAAPATTGASTSSPLTAVAEARAMAMAARSADLSAKRDQLANPSGTAPAADTATTASVQPTAPVPAAATAASAPIAVAARPQAASDVFPNPPAAFAAPQQQAQMPAAPAAPAADAPTADEALPPPDPITGPVPMPRHRPGGFALAETGVVPLPRARPTEAPEPEKTTTDTPNVYDPGLGAR